MIQFTKVLERLKKPSVTLSLASQIVSIMILMGYNLNENKIMAIMTIACTILVTLGIMSNPDTKKKGYGDDLVTCSSCGTKKPHVLVNGELVCAGCGTKVSPEEAAAEEKDEDDDTGEQILDGVEDILESVEMLLETAQ